MVEILDLDVTAEAAEEGANIDLDATRVGKSAVIKTSTRQTIFLPLIGLVDHEALKPGDLIGVNKDSYLVLDTLPAEYDSRVKAMEVDEKPTENYNDVGGLDKQIEELVEAVVWPMKEAERFKKIGIKAPKGNYCFPALSLTFFPSPILRFLLAHTLANARTYTTFHKKLTQELPNQKNRRTNVRTPRDGQDPPGTRLRRPNGSHLPQASRAPASPDVHRRRREASARLLRAGKGEGAVDHLHRRARRGGHQALRL